jgi:hypothetical protein
VTCWAYSSPFSVLQGKQSFAGRQLAPCFFSGWFPNLLEGVDETQELSSGVACHAGG